MPLSYMPMTVREHLAENSVGKAVLKAWDFRDVMKLAESDDRPGVHRENVLDFHDGLRLIVSRDMYSFGTFVHVSASLRSGYPLHRRLVRRPGVGVADIVEAFEQAVRHTWDRLGALHGLELGYWTSGLVPHYFYPKLPTPSQSSCSPPGPGSAPPGGDR